MTKTDLTDLQELRRLLTMERFRAHSDDAIVVNGHPTSATRFIVEATSTWRETWVLPALDRLIERGKRQTARRTRSVIGR